MLLTAVLIDAAFTSLTAETFEVPHTSKVSAFNVLARVLDIDALDFCVAFSSISGLFGNAGQTNYARCDSSIWIGTSVDISP